MGANSKGAIVDEWFGLERCVRSLARRSIGLRSTNYTSHRNSITVISSATRQLND